MTIYDRLKELDLDIPEPPAPGGIYELTKQTGNVIFTSGQAPSQDGKFIYTGKLGADVSIEDGKKAAALCVLNCLSVIEARIKDLNKITNIVKVLGFVSSAPNFNDQPEVINGASQLLVDIFGEKGKHARSAIGVNELPFNIAVEIEIIVEVE